MNYLEFKNVMFDTGCFSVHQVYAWQPGFDRNNFWRWTRKGLLIRLRQGFYTFPEYKEDPDYAMYFANRIYRPSYVSLHSALAFHGIIPEGVIQVTSVTSLKTNRFRNDLGDYAYHSVKPEVMFGYDLKPFRDGRTLQIAFPEKALVDLLYVYPFYNDEQSLVDLRLDDSFMEQDLDIELLEHYVVRIKNSALEERIRSLIKAYGL